MQLPALVAFDVDGTLLRGETICECIARCIGKAEEMRAFERLTARDDIAAARRSMLDWYKPFGKDQLLGHLRTVELAPGAKAGLGRLRELGIKTALVSITWSFAVAWLAAELGADYTVGTDWRDDDEVGDFWPDDKASWLGRLLADLNISPAALVAVGDSASDILMLKLAGRGYFVGTVLPEALPTHIHHHPAADIAALVEIILGAGKRSEIDAGPAIRDGERNSRTRNDG
jgi:HAD superfamily phosphoserine phosphatase-like hydrolase